MNFSVFYKAIYTIFANTLHYPLFLSLNTALCSTSKSSISFFTRVKYIFKLNIIKGKIDIKATS